MDAKPTKVLVTGANGQLGSRLMACGVNRDDVVLEGLTQADLDVCDREAVRKQVAFLRPDVVIHCAAYTAVDAAESNEGEAHRVNAEAVAHVAEACVAEGASMIHISTDYVFGLTEHRPLLPTDEVNPLGAYGRTKRAGERAFLESGVKGAVVRVAWLYDAEGKNFMNTMLNLAERHGALKVVDDQLGVPTAAPLLAEGLLDMAARRTSMPQGIWHFAHEGHASWHGFAQEIMRVAQLDVPVEAVSSDAFPTAAHRPAWSVLDGRPLRKEMGWPGIHWTEALQRCWELKKDV